MCRYCCLCFFYLIKEFIRHTCQPVIRIPTVALTWLWNHAESVPVTNQYWPIRATFFAHVHIHGIIKGFVRSKAACYICVKHCLLLAAGWCALPMSNNENITTLPNPNKRIWHEYTRIKQINIDTMRQCRNIHQHISPATVYARLNQVLSLRTKTCLWNFAYLSTIWRPPNCVWPVLHFPNLNLKLCVFPDHVPCSDMCSDLARDVEGFLILSNSFWRGLHIFQVKVRCVVFSNLFNEFKSALFDTLIIHL